MKQKVITPEIANCARCGAKAVVLDWDFRNKWRVYCDNTHTSTKQCGTAHRAICRWNNAQARFAAATAAPEVGEVGVGATCKIAGFAWPQTIGDWNLMGPSNRLGAWRWYKRIVLINDHPIEEQIKMDSQLQPVWESLIEVDDLGGPSLEEDL